MRAEQIYIFCIKTHSQIIRNLTTSTYYHTIRTFQVENIHYALKRKFIEIETIAHIIVGRNCFGIIINHDRTIALLTNGIERLYTTPVEFYRRTDAIGSRTQYDYRTLIFFKTYIMCHTAISPIQIVGLSRVLSGQRVDLLHNGKYTSLLTTCTNSENRLLYVHFLFHADSTSYLEIRETLNFCLTQEVIAKHINRCAIMKFLIGLMNLVKLLQEPTIDLGQIMNLVDSVTCLKCLFNNEDTLISRLSQGFIYIINLQFFIIYKAVHALTNHTKTFLNYFLESTSDGHYFAYRLH